jgi:hypothetical protein
MIDANLITADEYRRRRDASMTEAQLQGAIVERADVTGRLVFHDPDLHKCPGCGRVNSDGRRRGFPDLVIPVPPILFLWELKTMKGKVRPDQERWLDELAKCQVVSSGLIRPVDLEEALELLGGGAA